MNNASDVLFDSDAFIAMFVETDAHYQRVSAAWEQLQLETRGLAATNFVIAETATWLSRRDSQEVARYFLEYIGDSDFPVIYIDKPLQQAAQSLFVEQQNKNISMVDCANVIVMQHYHIPAILSFDHFYKRFDIQMFGS